MKLNFLSRTENNKYFKSIIIIIAIIIPISIDLLEQLTTIHNTPANEGISIDWVCLSGIDRLADGKFDYLHNDDITVEHFTLIFLLGDDHLRLQHPDNRIRLILLFWPEHRQGQSWYSPDDELSAWQHSRLHFH